MNKKREIYLSLHDVRVSTPQYTISAIKKMQERFRLPFAVYLVMDETLDDKSELFRFLYHESQNKNIEIVFHGNTHQCPVGCGKYLAFYHKYEAEYFCNSEKLISLTKKNYKNLNRLGTKNIGVCAPCWLMTKENHLLFQSLSPSFIEHFLYVESDNKIIFSPIISIGSSSKYEIVLLKLIAKTVIEFSGLSTHLRMAIHICDTEIQNTMEFFEESIGILKKKGYNFCIY